MQADKNVSQVEVVYEGSDDGTPINNWPDVLAVFAVKTNMDMENPQDVVVMDHEKSGVAALGILGYLCQFPAGGFFAGVEETCI